MRNNKARKLTKSKLSQQLANATVGNKEEIVSITGYFFHNLAKFIFPFYGLSVGTWKDYVDSKINKRRNEEINSCIKKLNKKIEKVKLKQEAIEYFEQSIVFKLEDIVKKLLTNPGRGFDELIAEYIANCLQDLSVKPETKDLIISSLLNLDSVDLLVLKVMDNHFLSNLSNKKAKGVTRDSMETLLKEHNIEGVVINRSLQRLQSEFIIQPLKVSVPGITEQPTAEHLYNGKRPDQYDAPGGYVNTDYGREFINFLNISNSRKYKK